VCLFNGKFVFKTKSIIQSFHNTAYRVRYNERYTEWDIAVHSKALYFEILANYENAQERYKRCHCKYCTYNLKFCTKEALLASVFVKTVKTQ